MKIASYAVLVLVLALGVLWHHKTVADRDAQIQQLQAAAQPVMQIAGYSADDEVTPNRLKRALEGGTCVGGGNGVPSPGRTLVGLRFE